MHNQQAARPQLHQDTTGSNYLCEALCFLPFWQISIGKTKGGSIPSFNGEILPECMSFVGLNTQKYKFYSIFTRPI